MEIETSVGGTMETETSVGGTMETEASVPIRRGIDPLPFDNILVDKFYWIRLTFPGTINVPSPENVGVDYPPIFDVEHLYKQGDDGLWKVDGRRPGQVKYFRPCLVLRVLPESKSILILIGSSRPALTHRWIPFQDSTQLPDQPEVKVQVSLPGAFKSSYLCYTHILCVKPVLRWAVKPRQKSPGIVHISPTVHIPTPDAPPMAVEVECTNTSEILSCHRSYWKSRGVVFSTAEDTEHDGPSRTTNPKDLGVANPDSIGFMFDCGINRSVSWADGEIRKMSDHSYQEMLRDTYGRPIKVLSSEGTPEDVEQAKKVVAEATNGLWLFEGELSSDDDDDDESESIQDLELPDIIEGVDFYPIEDTPWTQSALYSSSPVH
jgi:hypothetical protein